MVIDKLENANLFFGLNERINRAICYLQSTDFTQLDVGRYEIDGKFIYANVYEHETKNSKDGLLEAHKKYVDIHYVINGSEQIGVAILEDQTPIKEYDEIDDFTLYKVDYCLNLLKAGMFAIFFPDDLHMPGIKSDKFNKVKKIVVKVKI